jgi:hypothetical protein
MALGIASLVALSGCVTTQQRNVRAQLRATRLLASRKAVVVKRRNPDVRVEAVALIHDARESALVVTLRNRSPRVLTDLPISVGVTAGGRRTLLNRRGGLEYFKSHVAAIGPRALARWVFTTRTRIARRAHPFALVGAPAAPPVSAASSLPTIVVAPLAGTAAARSVRVRVHNPTPIPQYGLPVYALARRGTRYVAAGRGTLDDLGSGSTATIRLRLIGSAARASLQLEALPTIFR